MWNVRGTMERIGLSLEPDRILYEYDGPRIFTCKDSVDNLYLAYLCDEDAVSCRFLVVGFSDRLLDDLTGGKINMREALFRPRAWLVDLDNEWQIANSWRIEIEELPADALPKPGVMLWRHLPSVVHPVALRSASREVTVSFPVTTNQSRRLRTVNA